MIKKLLSVFLCSALLLTLSFAVFAEEETIPEAEPVIETTTITISSLADFLVFAESCRLDSYSRNLIVELEADINLGGSSFAAIPSFSGTLHGNGHTVSGLDIALYGSVQGLFRYLTDTAIVEDLHVQGSVHPQGSRDTVGGIAGSNAGTIRNCSFSGSLSGSDSVGGLVGINTVTGIVQNCQVEGDIHGDHFVGGIAGSNLGVIRNCTNSMDVNTTPQQNSVELSQITLDTLTNAESVSTVTDIGGIAGNSSGVIRGCINHGAVGYQHMGYNIGGIAGSQMGYITECENYGSVSGRKEVGGIVGQMEPATNIQFSTDTLQILEGQLDTLSSLAKQATGHAQGSAASVSSQIASIQDQAETAKDAINQLIPSEDHPQLPDMDSLQAAQNTLNSSLSSMQGSLKSISSSVQSAAGTLSKDMQAISKQIEAMGQTINGASETLGGSIADISDADTPEDTTGKVESCRNYAPVFADLNVGGITGAMALENDLDPEADVEISGDTSLNFDSQLRAVILSCRNAGPVSAGKQNAGGIAGWMTMGLVKKSVNTGDVSAASASYVGGIAGQQTTGFIRACSVKCSITGKTYVGGIAGAAETVSDCRSMTLLSATEKVGGILGFAEVGEQLYGNYYLTADTDPGAIDGISYDGRAQLLADDAFLALEDLEPFFRTISVRFCFEDGTETAVTLNYGEALSDEDIPILEERDGQLSYWDGLTSDPLYFDAVYTQTYTPRTTVIQYPDPDPHMPLLLAEGSFGTDAAIIQMESPAAPALKRNQALLQAVSFTVSESTSPITIRCRLPEEYDADTVSVLLQNSDGSWEDVPCEIFDSYVVFSVTDQENHVAVIGTTDFPWLMVGGIAAAMALVCVIVTITVKKKHDKKTAINNTTE